MPTPRPQRGKKTVTRRQEAREPRLPHERDESADSQGGAPRPEIEQAAEDLAQGREDTDRGPVVDRVYRRQKTP